uniref:Uncharacterized protein n=1 Tax=Spongospora subterranea TaxID=70186 RepID=A0A0H5QLT2_9EUKA|eukprot:CRZ02567.1 hypothetical protein [Spongospora subterranea]
MVSASQYLQSHRHRDQPSTISPVDFLRAHTSTPSQYENLSSPSVTSHHKVYQIPKAKFVHRHRHDHLDQFRSLQNFNGRLASVKLIQKCWRTHRRKSLTESGGVISNPHPTQVAKKMVVVDVHDDPQFPSTSPSNVYPLFTLFTRPHAKHNIRGVLIILLFVLS